jgi:tetratricopeptide (TPR) repeat protein
MANKDDASSAVSEQKLVTLGEGNGNGDKAGHVVLKNNVELSPCSVVGVNASHVSITTSHEACRGNTSLTTSPAILTSQQQGLGEDVGNICAESPSVVSLLSLPNSWCRSDAVSASHAPTETLLTPRRKNSSFGNFEILNADLPLLPSTGTLHDQMNKPSPDNCDKIDPHRNAVVNDKAATLHSPDSFVLKPFFIMDWLDNLSPAEFAAAHEHLRSDRPKYYAPPSLQTKEDYQIPKTHWAAGLRKVLLPLFERHISLPGSPSSPKQPHKEKEVASPTSSASFRLAFDGTRNSQDSCNGNSPCNSFLERSIHIGNIWNARGLHKAENGLWTSALKCWDNALEIRMQVLGETHIDVANTWNNYGIALGELAASNLTLRHQYFQDAVHALQCALRIRILHYGEAHVEVAAVLHNLGNLHHQMESSQEAVSYFCAAKRIQEQVYGGSNHVFVARTCLAVGHAYYHAGAYLDARASYLDAIQIFREAGVSMLDAEVRLVHADIMHINKLLGGTGGGIALGGSR